MKRFFVLFLCILAVFAIVSCKSEPKQDNEVKPEVEPEVDTTPKATDEDVLAGKAYYRLTATAQAKRFSFMYVGKDDDINPKAGDVLSITYRSEHPVTYLYLRDTGSVKFIYKYEILAENDPYVSAADEDGWITLTYTYPETPMEGAYDETEGTVTGFLLEIANYDQKFQVDDYLEIKAFSFNGQKLTIEGPETEAEAAGYQSENGIWNRGNGDQTDPVLSRIFFET